MQFGAQQATAQILIKNVSAPRFETYIDCATDLRHAARLYRWNLAMSGALHESLSIVEVALRNAMDRELKIWNLKSSMATQEWVQYPARPLEGVLNPANNSTYDSALGRALQSRGARVPGHRRHAAPVVHDDLVANITFGTWKKLLPRKMSNQPHGIGAGPQRGMWNHALRKAFPNKPHATAVHYWVSQVHSLRNRVAHAEPLVHCDFAAYHRTATRLLRAIDVDMGQWHSGVSRVPEVAAQRP